MSTKFFTNSNGNTLLSKFEGVFQYTTVHAFDALVGYFRASGYFRLQEWLTKVPEIRILVGINVDPLIQHAHQQGLQFIGRSDEARKAALKTFADDIQKAEYSKQVEDGIIWFVDRVASGQIKVKAHPSQRLHSKIYIFRPEVFNKHNSGSVITGSSNLSASGLEHNFEFNVELKDYDDVAFATSTFEELWQQSIDILPADIATTVRKKTYLGDPDTPLTPYELFIKLLMQYFGKAVDYDPSSASDLPTGFKRLKYQVDAVNDGYRKMMKHYGFFLADVVGLGKTIVGTLIARRYLVHLRTTEYIGRALIITPPALETNWKEAIKKFSLAHIGHYDVITNGSLHKLPHAAEDYDLIIVDEAHKFRNDTAEMYGDLQRLCKTPTRRVLPNGQKDRKRVILISATPLNNRPQDIANQVYLFQDAKDSTLEVANLQHFFRQHIDAYDKLKKQKSTSIVRSEVKRIYADIRDKVLEPIIVRRTRTDLKVHELYKQDLEEQGIRFPHVGKPDKILYQLPPALEQLFDETMHALTRELTYNRYRAIQHLTEPKKSKYRYADRISLSLAQIMRVLLVKRIDSSFHAFRISLRRFCDATGAMVKMFEQGKIYIAPKLSITEYVMAGQEDELEALMLDLQLTDPSIEICTPDEFLPKFLEGLKADLIILERLMQGWDAVDSQDPKLDEFLQRLEPELFDPARNYKQKLVIFSEAKDTTSYLHQELAKHSKRRVLVVDSTNRAAMMPVVRENFDANFTGVKKDDYDIIIATEVLAEGINLHRSNVILNYDTPWNSTRLMQRIGRVNRIGSEAPQVFVFNFFPTAQVNSNIELEHKAFMKLQAFHEALGEDSEVYSPDEETGTFGLFDKKLEDERDKRLDYLMLLRKLRDEDPELFRRIRSLPLRARTARKGLPSPDPGTTLTYLRNAHRDIFYASHPDGALEEMSFLEAVTKFEALPDEPAFGLPEHHHGQVRAATTEFSRQVQREASRPQAVTTKLPPQEKRALAFLDACLSLPFLDAGEQQLLRAAKGAIVRGQYVGLQRDINKLHQSHKTTRLVPTALIHALLAILGKYALSTDAVAATNPHHKETEDVLPDIDTEPDIIISESFIA
ncbi:helicase-related protein [Hymenobacter actinosclerus]|uniref:SNF2 family N-terminal domain-containing protein n=1 Tax=Hymenobacter actinosclerus TaxID=82805 RepID=A0A1I0IQF4_9BACT|nr:helicase-related protein [Hymenobacter actinosclerus]SET99435.1 SNF2 family N-terminal domain-containing protein [Hymenobacter actinosclerus]